MDEQEVGNQEDPGQGAGQGEASSERNPGTNPAGNGSLELSPLHVKLPVYEGPLDLLLDLIKKSEMDIYDIQVSEITRQYLETLEHMKELDLEVAGEFIVMAATLIYIKSKMLLPQDNTDDELLEQDPRAELVRKLLEYQAFKEAAKKLGFMEDERGMVFTRQISDYYLADLNAEDVGIDTFSANLYDLLSAFQSVLARAGKEAFHEVYEQIITIEERTVQVRGLLEEKKKITFSELFTVGTWSRNLLIVTFLTILEIVRTKYARVAQDKHYGEIMIEKIEEAV